MKIAAMNNSLNINSVSYDLAESIVKGKNEPGLLSINEAHSLPNSYIDMSTFCKSFLLVCLLFLVLAFVQTANADNNINKNNINKNNVGNHYNVKVNSNTNSSMSTHAFGSNTPTNMDIAKIKMTRYTNSTRVGLSRVNVLNNLDKMGFKGVVWQQSTGMGGENTKSINKKIFSTSNLLNSKRISSNQNFFMKASMDMSLPVRDTHIINNEYVGNTHIQAFNATNLKSNANTQKNHKNSHTPNNSTSTLITLATTDKIDSIKDVQQNHSKQMAQNQANLQVSSSEKSTTDNFIPVDFASINIKKHELATMQVLSEVCPNFLNKGQYESFNKGFNTQLHELMPKVKNHKAAMKYLSNQKDYKQILVDMKSWNLSFTDDENIKMCQDVVNYK